MSFFMRYIRNIFNSIAGWFGETQVPKSRAELLLTEEVRAKWEHEQEELKKQLVLQDTSALLEMLNTPKEGNEAKEYYIAGVDISFVKDDDVNACAALVILSYPCLQEVYTACEMVKLTEPYIPGFLGFREVLFIVQLFDQMRERVPCVTPHVVMVDGNGILHPREFGSACHLGVSLGLPCIGVAKKLFHVDGLEKDAEHQAKIKSLEKGGDTFPLIGKSGKTLGMALRSCSSSHNPVYVSPGHLVTMDTAVQLVHSCCKHRVPEPVRLADIKSREYIREHFKPEVKMDS